MSTATVMIRAILRPESTHAVMAALLEAGFPAVTKLEVFGRGRQRGMRVGDVHYDEIAKEMLLTVVPVADKDLVVRTILETARTKPKGAYGDGKIFITPVEEVHTISTGRREN